MRAYSVDLRQRVIHDCDAGTGTRAVAGKYSVRPSWVRELKRQSRGAGSVQPITAAPGPAPTLWGRHSCLPGFRGRPESLPHRTETRPSSGRSGRPPGRPRWGTWSRPG
jgi:hypothetical protein